MASNKTTTTTKAPQPVAVALPQPAMAATANPTTANPTAPSPAALAAARTSAAQAAAWLAAGGNTMPSPALVVAVGPSQPRGRNATGPRAQHGAALQGAVAALGGQATVAAVAAWCKAHGAKYGPCGPQAGSPGNVRCALAQGVLVAVAAPQ